MRANANLSNKLDENPYPEGIETRKEAVKTNNIDPKENIYLQKIIIIAI